ncbi:MAG: hypothetical protein ACJ79M_19100 [Myxococcales bacterium]
MLDSNLFEAMAQPLAPFARIACGRVGPLLGVPILVRFDLREPPLDAIAAPALLPEPFEFVIDTLALAFVGALPPR